MKEKSIIKKVIIVLGVLSAVIMGTLPLIRMVVSPEISVMMLTTGGVMFILAMAVMVVSMLINPQMIIKLTALPVAYVLVMVGYIIYKLNVYQIFKMMLGAEVQQSEQLLSGTASVGKLSMMLHGGAWIASIPLIISVIVEVIKLNKRKKVDFSLFNESKGIITNVIDTHTKINKVKAYKISFKISHYEGGTYSVTKKFLVPAHMLHTVGIGQEVTLKINPKKKEDVYIQNEYGII